MDAPGLFDDATPVDLNRLRLAHVQARAFYRQHLSTADGPCRYLQRRGFGALARHTPLTADNKGAPWFVGYAPPGPAALVAHLTPAFAADELTAAGLAVQTRTGRLIDRFRDRIMLPIHTADGDPIAFIGRAAPGAAFNVPKYLNSPDTAIYHKGQTLYGVGEQTERIAAGWAPVLVEGPLDVLAIWLTHPDTAHPDTAGPGRIGVGTCGTALTHDQASTVAALPGATRNGITTAFDNDPAGRQATCRAWQILTHHTQTRLYAATLPAGTDPAGLYTAGQHTDLHAALNGKARPLGHAVIDFTLDNLTTRRPDLLHRVEGRVGAARTLAALITNLPPHQIVALAPYIADRTATSLDTITTIIIDTLETAPAQRQARTAVRAKPPPGARGRAFTPPDAAGIIMKSADDRPSPAAVATSSRRRRG